MNEKELAIVNYSVIVEYRKKHPLPETEYGEVHHILPKSCGGSNDKSNLIRLKPEEHFLCHCFLPYIFDEGENHENMVYAWCIMSNANSISLEEYGDLRRELVEYLRERPVSEEHRKKISEALKGIRRSEETRRKISEAKKGKPSWIKGKRHSEETRRKMSETRRGHSSGMKGKHLSEETRRRISEALKGIRFSEEHKQRIGEAQKGKPKTWLKGKPHPISEETRRKISEARKLYWQRKKEGTIQ